MLPALSDLPCDTALIDGEVMAGAGLSGFADLQAAFKDSSPDVRIAAAQALGQFGTETDLKEVLPFLADQADWQKHNVFQPFSGLLQTG